MPHLDRLWEIDHVSGTPEIEEDRSLRVGRDFIHCPE